MRSARDRWDITTSVGATALFVAAARGLAARQEHPLAVDPFAEVFCRAAGGDWAQLFDADPEQTRDHPLRSTDFGLQFQDFQAARTRYFDHYFHAAAQAGVRQIVLLAAGLDARAYRLDWPAGTVIHELDREPVLEFKRSVLTAHGDTPRAERREVAVDLREDWWTPLRANGFEPSDASAWIAEGLLIYLTPDAQDDLFARIDTQSAAGSRLGVEEMKPIPAADYAEMTVPTDVTATTERNADWATLIYNEPRNEAVQWFADRGWTGQATSLSEYLTSLGRPARPASSDTGHLRPELISLTTVVKPG
ncbi:SAM-dependent methyltransferase [Speluncibacter jeojiensis]|uniref:SAM-dependent methyltransferase n=1 Tax=Speluncibacter jeojiensis TaxID=2710754 RepID=UPI002FC80590